MPSQEQIAAEIERLETLLSSGATSVTSDGETVQIDQAAVRRRLAELQALQTGEHYRSRRVRTLDLSNAF
jgi:hypothetical protein